MGNTLCAAEDPNLETKYSIDVNKLIHKRIKPENS